MWLVTPTIISGGGSQSFWWRNFNGFVENKCCTPKIHSQNIICQHCVYLCIWEPELDPKVHRNTSLGLPLLLVNWFDFTKQNIYPDLLIRIFDLLCERQSNFSSIWMGCLSTVHKSLCSCLWSHGNFAITILLYMKNNP
jgi:hypothetical protein